MPILLLVWLAFQVSIEAPAREKGPGETGSCDRYFIRLAPDSADNRSGLSPEALHRILGTIPAAEVRNRYITARDHVARRDDLTPGQKAALLHDLLRIVSIEAPADTKWFFDRYRTAQGDFVFESVFAANDRHNVIVIRQNDGRLFRGSRRKGASRAGWEPDYQNMESMPRPIEVQIR